MEARQVPQKCLLHSLSGRNSEEESRKPGMGGDCLPLWPSEGGFLRLLFLLIPVSHRFIHSGSPE
jgi:hypothetical protein